MPSDLFLPGESCCTDSLRRTTEINLISNTLIKWERHTIATTASYMNQLISLQQIMLHCITFSNACRPYCFPKPCRRQKGLDLARKITTLSIVTCLNIHPKQSIRNMTLPFTMIHM